MADIPATSMTGSGTRVVTVTTLGASDTFTYNPSKEPILVLNNVTAGALTVLIDGDGATTVPVKGVGSVDVSGGYDDNATPIGIGATVAIPLASISGYLLGVIAVTGGTGIEATLLEF